MPTLKLLSLIIVNLPSIIRLIDAMEKHAADEARDRKVASDLKAVEDAFKTKDAAALNKLFRS